MIRLFSLDGVAGEIGIAPFVYLLAAIFIISSELFLTPTAVDAHRKQIYLPQQKNIPEGSIFMPPQYPDADIA